MHRLASLPAIVVFACFAAAQTLTIPNGTATAEGSTSNAFPWGTSTVMHQAIYDSTNFTAQGIVQPMTITRLRWRPDASSARNWSNYSYTPATIRMSTCPVNHTAASATFANNRGSDLTTVYTGPVAYAAGSSLPPGPAPFLVDVWLSTPFVYNPSAGDLNIECDLTAGGLTGTAGLMLDVQSGNTLCTRVYSPVGGPTGIVEQNHGVVVELTFAGGSAMASATPYGTGCVSQVGSFYELFTNGASFDLSNTSLTMINTGTGYLVMPGFTAYVPPSPNAQVLQLFDDSETTVALPAPFPYPGGTTTALTVCSNGFVSVLPGNGINFAPTVGAMLNATQTAWWNWHDYNPSVPLGGQVKFEVVAGIAYITWDGVFDFGGSAASANTMQFQFDTATGFVHRAWGQTSAGGNPFLIGWSAGGPSIDPGNRDISATLPNSFWVSVADVQPLGISATTRPVSGTNCVLRTSNIPVGSPFGAILFGTTRWSPGQSLAGVGMATCWQWHNGIASTLFVGPGATHQLSLPIPFGFAGTHVYAQSVVYCPNAGLTSLGAIASQGLDLYVHNL